MIPPCDLQSHDFMPSALDQETHYIPQTSESGEAKVAHGVNIWKKLQTWVFVEVPNSS